MPINDADNPKYGKAYGLMGISYYELGTYEKAIKCFEQTIKIDPKDGNAYRVMGFPQDATTFVVEIL
jgi:tetratricopeptide (TPR) repeat protein